MGIAPDLETLLRRMTSSAPALVAGLDGRHQPVLAVEVLGGAMQWSTVAPGALLVAGAAALAGSAADLVAAATAAGAVGVLVATGEAPPTDLVTAADRASLPVAATASAGDPAVVVVEALHALVAHQRERTGALEDRFAAITLEELISSDRTLATEAVERASTLGWDLRRPRAVLLASIDPPVDPEIARRVLGTVSAAARATLGDDAIVWTRATSVAALLAADEHAGQRRRLADALREELDERVREVTLSIGVGRCVEGPADLATSFVDANRAVDVGRWAKGRHVTELYDELGLERLFASVPEPDLHDFVLHAIGPLLDHDRAQGTELVETLSTWLEARNMAEAARRMFVHYNTFKNRLERIEAILGPVLNDAAHLLECEVAIHVSRHYDGPWRTPPRA